ncbi:MAG: LPP20 family lipoprotein [Campylobacterales bacterium]|nr:LPP20 family lipoprotein [Campylobacterales bacterium]
MKYSLVLLSLLATLASAEPANTQAPAEKTMDVVTPTPTTSTINVSCPTQECPKEHVTKKVDAPQIEEGDVLERDNSLLISVVGQGVAPMNTTSPAQAYALAKRAATADAYRLIAEKVKGVRVEGQDLIQNMMVKRSSVRTSVTAMVKNAAVVETTFKEGLCEVEMEITLSHSQFPQ